MWREGPKIEEEKTGPLAMGWWRGYFYFLLLSGLVSLSKNLRSYREGGQMSMYIYTARDTGEKKARIYKGTNFTMKSRKWQFIIFKTVKGSGRKDLG